MYMYKWARHAACSASVLSMQTRKQTGQFTADEGSTAVEMCIESALILFSWNCA